MVVFKLTVLKRWFWYCLSFVWPCSCPPRGCFLCFAMFFVLLLRFMLILSDIMITSMGKRELVTLFCGMSLRKHVYSSILKILPPKNENFQIKKKSDIFYISAKSIYCGYSLEPPRQGGSNEYPQYIFLSRNKKNNVYLCKPQFYYIKVAF